MIEYIKNIIETLEKSNANEIKCTFEFEKDKNTYILTYVLIKKEES